MFSIEWASYHFSINGIPACANYELLTVILRNEWNFNGYVVSDDGALENVVNRHKYVKNYTEAAAVCINAGCNLELGNTAYQSITTAVKAKLLTEEKVRYTLYALRIFSKRGKHAVG